MNKQDFKIYSCQAHLAHDLVAANPQLPLSHARVIVFRAINAGEILKIDLPTKKQYLNEWVQVDDQPSIIVPADWVEANCRLEKPDKI